MTRWLVGAVIGLLAGGCGRTANNMTPMVGDARRFVTGGDLRSADSSLAQCSRAHPADAEGAHCRYWLVLVRLDPAHPGPARGAVDAAREFLARDISAPGREEITLLLRVAAQRESLLASIDSTRNILATHALAAQTPLRDEPAARDKDEIERLRTELAKTQDELQRIKRRLSAPRP